MIHIHFTIIVCKGGRITIPKVIREKLHIKEGTPLKMSLIGKSIEVRRK
ncbi:MAG: AbrB/MazE/SpoVT family DNA-binding domain-containing protein [archaeon]|nr:AbrB/MazE/SpoVT family DNA-binding domain-containing protein [archaeon]